MLLEVLYHDQSVAVADGRRQRCMSHSVFRYLIVQTGRDINGPLFSKTRTRNPSSTHQIWSLIFFPLSSTVLILKSTPVGQKGAHVKTFLTRVDKLSQYTRKLLCHSNGRVQLGPCHSSCSWVAILRVHRVVFVTGLFTCLPIPHL